MEIYKRLAPALPYTIWQGKDAEGRRGYASTLNHQDGTVYEPVALPYNSIKSLLTALGLKRWPKNE